MSGPPNYLSASSANALVSDLRPTTLSPPTLTHINALLDELLVSLISASQSINPKDIRLRGVPAVFAGNKPAGESTGLRALGRSAIGEAELELRSWYESHTYARRANTGYPPDGKGQGLVAEKVNAAFPVSQAVELLRLKCVSFSTLASQVAPSKNIEAGVVAAWRNAGGDTSEESIAPTALWITAILEHVCEHVLSQLSRVVSRDSSVTVAGVQDLYTALCEDESVWGFFKRMRVKESLEASIRTSTKRATQSNGSPRHSVGSREGSLDSGSRFSFPPEYRGSSDTSRFAGIAGGLSRKISSKGLIIGGNENTSSIFHVKQRSAPSASVDRIDLEPRSHHDDEDEFDALVRSSETMKVSLTPSRLRTFDASNGRGSPQNARTRSILSTPPHSNDMPSISGSYGESSRPPVKTASRSRAGSTKLLARDAMTIEEQKEEDDPGGRPRQQRKESLIELLNSESAGDENRNGKITKSPVRRTIPAVVLGTPPPIPTEQLLTQSPSLNRPNRGEFLSHNDTDEAKVKQKTSAEELADFFNTTAPPTSNGISPISTKNKGFKSFISKVTGKKNDERPERAPTPTLFSSASRSHLDLGEPMLPGRQKAAQNIEAVPPSSYRPVEIGPSSNKGILRKRSRDNAVSNVGGGVESEDETVGKPEVVSVMEGSSTSPASHTALPLAHAAPLVITNGRKLDDEHNGSSTVNTPSRSSPLTPPITPVGDKQSTLSIANVGLLEPRQGLSERTPSVSDANSFRTADEGEELDDGRGDPPKARAVEQEKGIHETDNEPEVGLFVVPPRPNAPVLLRSDSFPDPLTPSIPLAELTPLHSVLQHARSARECQLLLSAILSQWGVPQPILHPAVDTPTPEWRVAAWLLAGRDGPALAGTPTSPTYSKADDEVITPKQAYSAHVAPPQVAVFSNGNDEEILSSETASQVSTSGDELGESVTPSYAKSAHRSTPSLVLPVDVGKDRQ